MNLLLTVTDKDVIKSLKINNAAGLDEILEVWKIIYLDDILFTKARHQMFERKIWVSQKL